MTFVEFHYLIWWNTIIKMFSTTHEHIVALYDSIMVHFMMQFIMHFMVQFIMPSMMHFMVLFIMHFMMHFIVRFIMHFKYVNALYGALSMFMHFIMHHKVHPNAPHSTFLISLLLLLFVMDRLSLFFSEAHLLASQSKGLTVLCLTTAPQFLWGTWLIFANPLTGGGGIFCLIF